MLVLVSLILGKRQASSHKLVFDKRDVMTIYYYELEDGNGEFEAASDHEAILKRSLDCLCVYRESNTLNGTPFVIVWERDTIDQFFSAPEWSVYVDKWSVGINPDVYVYDTSTFEDVCQIGGGELEERLANARLIAQAPQLREALADLLAMLGDAGFDGFQAVNQAEALLGIEISEIK